MDIQSITEQLIKLDNKIIAALIAAIVSIIIAVLNYLNQRKALKLQARQLSNIEKESKIEKIQKQLNDFYVPFDQYLSKTTEYYKNFRNGLPKEFRTLVYLIDKNATFENSEGNFEKVNLNDDKSKILRVIISIQEELQKLIIEKSSIIDDPFLIKSYNPDTSITDIKLLIDKEQPSSIPKEIGMLTLFSMHIDYLKMAFNGQIDKSELKIIKNYVYPRELNNKIKNNIKDLRNKISELSKK